VTDIPLHFRSIGEVSTMLAEGKTSSAELTELCLARIQVHANLGAFLAVDAEGARVQAKAADERRKAGKSLGALDGIPIAHKDMLCTQGIPTTAGSRILEGYVPPYDATVVKRWKDSGTVLLGKLNQDEFGMGSSTENSAYGVTRNPWDVKRTPGGSSGGTSAAIAAGLCFGATGTDTGGSIRQPAALTGTVGFKPTYGRVSRFGCIAYASSLDQVGPVARTVQDAGLLLQALAGFDPKDSTSIDRAVPDYSAALKRDVRGMKVGIPREFMEMPGLDPEVAAAVEGAVKALEKLGASVVKVSLPHTRFAGASYYVIAPAEASSNLARYDGLRFGPRREPPKASLRDVYELTRGELFGAEVKRRILLGTYVLSAGYYDAYYGRAQKVRTLIARDFEDAFKSVDVIACPTTPTAAFKLGEKTQDPVQMYLSDVFTLSCNLAGLPGLSVPCGFTTSKLPIGLQLLGRPFGEEALLQAAHAYEQSTDWHHQHPELP